MRVCDYKKLVVSYSHMTTHQQTMQTWEIGNPETPYTSINTAYGEAEAIMKRLRHDDSLDELSQRPPWETSIFRKAIELEYPLLELAWKRCLEFEAGSSAVSLAAAHFDSLALIDTERSPSSSGSVRVTAPEVVTIHDVEDLHNEVKLCIMQLAKKRKGANSLIGSGGNNSM